MQNYFATLLFPSECLAQGFILEEQVVSHLQDVFEAVMLGWARQPAGTGQGSPGRAVRRGARESGPQAECQISRNGGGELALGAGGLGCFLVLASGLGVKGHISGPRWPIKASWLHRGRSNPCPRLEELGLELIQLERVWARCRACGDVLMALKAWPNSRVCYWHKVRAS